MVTIVRYIYTVIGNVYSRRLVKFLGPTLQIKLPEVEVVGVKDLNLVVSISPIYTSTLNRFQSGFKSV